MTSTEYPPPHWKLIASVVFTTVILIISSTSPLLLAWIKGTIETGTTQLSNVETGLQQMITGGDLMAVSILLSTLTSVPLILFFIKLKRGSDLRSYLALHSVSYRSYFVWGAVIVALSLCLDFATPWLGVEKIPPFMIEIYNNTETMWLLFFAVVIAAPLWEELLFRGFLMRGLQSSFITGVGAVVITSAVWAMIHFQYEWQYLVMVFVVGLVLGCARLITGSVYVPIMMHALNNALAFAQLALLRDSA